MNKKITGEGSRWNKVNPPVIAFTYEISDIIDWYSRNIVGIQFLYTLYTEYMETATQVLIDED